MATDNSTQIKIVAIIELICKERKYQCQKENRTLFTRIIVGNLTEKINVDIYNTGSITIGGKESNLKKEFIEIKKQIIEDPAKFMKHENLVKSCATSYNLVSNDFKRIIREIISAYEGLIELVDNPNTNITYRASIIKNKSKITITQYNSGTLLLQGKNDSLFDDICSIIEKTANPGANEIISRFISDDEDKLREVALKVTPQLIIEAEVRVRSFIGDAYDFLDNYDQKYLIASECLRIVEVPLPEYSPIVMPAAKAFEGFVKKIMISIGLVTPTFFQQSGATFSALSDKNNSMRKSICNKEHHVDQMMTRMKSDLDVYRNFMMHSDSGQITKVDTLAEANKSVNSILHEIERIFNYFNGEFQFYP
ncbi:hypothetical protein J2741_001489 [Methanolinea mesophila]|uniref:type II toxin-antitoxin system RnlA family toxin n=1 Tax=Methanolinea mesophila TaxID=547055 RepID=UPI001AE1D1D6|nr:type II toxin-antitoxin system RnlA family toxin [Methanolinea mesophila]MBP1928942.1 hypothetical protein [Methanolinea mesophila]